MKVNSILNLNNITRQGKIIFNGYYIQISNNMNVTIKNINSKSSLTGITAKLENNKIVLISKNYVFNIYDPNKLFYKIYQDKLLGKKDNSIIQILGKYKQNITINYYTKRKKLALSNVNNSIKNKAVQSANSFKNTSGLNEKLKQILYLDKMIKITESDYDIAKERFYNQLTPVMLMGRVQFTSILLKNELKKLQGEKDKLKKLI